jgi:periplasmic protein TonB
MRRSFILSLSLHAALIGALAVAARPAPPPVAPALIELRFGPAAHPPHPPAIAGTAGVAGTPDAAARPGSPGALAVAGAAASPTVPPGMRLAAPDPTVLPARAAPDNPPPAYPGEALARGEAGTVLLRLSIGLDGRVERVEKLRSSGFPTLDDAAMSAVARWRFQPARADGRPVASQRDQPVRFVLD